MPERLQCAEGSAWPAGRAINEAGLAFRQSQAEVLSQVSKPKEPTRLGYRHQEAMNNRYRRRSL
jgi:hypothetical protein